MGNTDNVKKVREVILGLDMGPSSLGWSLLGHTNCEVISTGVRVFPEGVDKYNTGGEKSKSQGRRESRMMRRQVQRKARRLSILREALAEARLLPARHAEQVCILGADPYELRMKALTDRLEPFELGRVFFHLAKRRGFLSSRKTDKADKAQEKETQGMLAEIAQLDTDIKEAGCQTLGEYLGKINADNELVRKRHTRRSMYLEEFEALWAAQSKHHPDLLTDEVKYGSQGKKVYPQDADSHRRLNLQTHLNRYGLHGIIFFQRRVYWPASLIGTCELEPTHKRAHKADRLAQRFRMLQEVNNLSYWNKLTGQTDELTDEQRSEVLDLLGTVKELKFDRIRTRLAKFGLPNDVSFNMERGQRSKLKGHLTDAALGGKKCLDKEWFEMPEAQKDQVVRILTDPSLSDIEVLDELQGKGGLTAEQAELAAKVNLPEGHIKHSRKAIQKLLPYLEQRFSYLGKDETDSALHAAGYLPRNRYGEEEFLPPVPNGITNPVVRQALFETRKVVNAIIREHGMPGAIRVEIAREAKKSGEERQKILKKNAKLNRERENAADRMEEMGVEHPGKRKNTTKYMLWEEAGRVCVYCGTGISQAQLVSGEANVDHILPRWRSLDDSYMNKVLSHRSCNEEKGDRTPVEWLKDSQPERYQEILARVKDWHPAKAKRFSREDMELDGFVNRHLTDTAYISTLVKDYLMSLGIPVSCSRGSITSELRYQWNLNTILNPDGDGKKTREDHRHHAVDAAVIALVTPSILHQLSQGGSRNRDRRMALPWPAFRDDLVKSISEITVSHKPRRTISGALHEETFFGATQKREPEKQVAKGERPWAKDWMEEEEKLYVRRKPVSEVKNAKHLAKVRDKAIRECLANHLRERDVDPQGNKAYPKGIFEGDNAPAMPSGVPIKKVRWAETKETLRPASTSVRRNFQHVQPGANHHICYYETLDNKGQPKWKAKVTTRWDAVLRVRRDKLPAVDRSDCELSKFVMSLSINECFTIDGDDGEEKLCVVRKLNQGKRQVTYKFHTDARKADVLDPLNQYFSPDKMRQAGAKKVTVDPIGRVRNSGD